MAERRGFDKFVRTKLPNDLVRRYRRFEILSEADLQSVVWESLRKYLRRNSEQPELYQVVNQLYCKDTRGFPDILVFRKGKPWVCIELKEKTSFRRHLIREDWQSLIDAREKLKAKRGYLIYLARRGNPKEFQESIPVKNPFLAFVAVAMSAQLTQNEFAEWNKEYRKRSKLVLPQRASVNKKGRDKGTLRAPSDA